MFTSPNYLINILDGINVLDGYTAGSYGWYPSKSLYLKGFGHCIGIFIVIQFYFYPDVPILLMITVQIWLSDLAPIYDPLWYCTMQIDHSILGVKIKGRLLSPNLGRPLWMATIWTFNQIIFWHILPNIIIDRERHGWNWRPGEISDNYLVNGTDLIRPSRLIFRQLIH